MNYKQYNNDKIVEWRNTSDQKIRNKLEMDLITTNKPVLEKYFSRWGDWALSEIYIQLTLALKTYDIDHPKMSFIGYWKQKLDWKLPKKNSTENSLMKLPYDATIDEKAEYNAVEYVSYINVSSLYNDDKDVDGFQLSDSVNYNDEDSQWD